MTFLDYAVIVLVVTVLVSATIYKIRLFRNRPKPPVTMLDDLSQMRKRRR